MRLKQPGEQAAILTFDLLMFCCVDQSKSAWFSNIHGPWLRGNIWPLTVLIQTHPCGSSEKGCSPRLTASLMFAFSPQEITPSLFGLIRNRKQLSCWQNTAKPGRRFLRLCNYFGDNKTGYCKLGAPRGKCWGVSGTIHLAAQFETVCDQSLQLK